MNTHHTRAGMIFTRVLRGSAGSRVERFVGCSERMKSSLLDPDPGWESVRVRVDQRGAVRGGKQTTLTSDPGWEEVCVWVKWIRNVTTLRPQDNGPHMCTLAERRQRSPMVHTSCVTPESVIRESAAAWDAGSSRTHPQCETGSQYPVHSWTNGFRKRLI